MSKEVNINTSKVSDYKTPIKYYGNYLGIVIQNNDPEKNGKVKVWIPHVSPSVYENWDNTSKDSKFKFIGKNINSDLSDIIEDLKMILPWAHCAAPLNGASSSGRYNAYDQTATISDSSNVSDLNHNNNFVKTKYSLNEDGIGEKPARKYELDDLKITDAFVDSSKIKFENGNKFGYNYTPTSYSNSAKGSFSVPNVGSHVWVFFDDGDPMSPVYFAVSYGQNDWQSIYDNENDPGLDYPNTYENKSSNNQDKYDHNTTTYRNKYVINQKGGTFEIVSTDNRELLKLTHFSGSFKEFSNYVTTEFASNNDQKLVQNDQFLTVKGNRGVYVGEDFDHIVNGDYYHKVGNLNYDVFNNYKAILDSIADAKQLFDIRRASTISPEVGFFKKTSLFQNREGEFGPCPVCTADYKPTLWDNNYNFISLGEADPNEIDDSNFNLPSSLPTVVNITFEENSENTFISLYQFDAGDLGLDPSEFTFTVILNDTSMQITKLLSVANSTGSSANVSNTEYGTVFTGNTEIFELSTIVTGNEVIIGLVPLTNEAGTINVTRTATLTVSSALTSIYDNENSFYDFTKVKSINDKTVSTLIKPKSRLDFLGLSRCPVCGGSGKSPSTQTGIWIPEDKQTLIVNRLQTISSDLIDLEKQMGRGGNEIVTITKNKIENIGLAFNDFPSIRVDNIGKIDIDEVRVFDKGVLPTQKPRSLFEYVHVDNLPGGTLVQNINNKWNVQVGSGGISIKTLGGVDIGGSITNITGQQLNLVSEEEINIDAKCVNIAAEILLLRNKKNKQVVVDGNLGVTQNIVIGGSAHIEGELTVQHITAPVEIQETEPVILYGELVPDLQIIDSNGKSLPIPNSVKIYAHTHPFKNLPLTLMKSKDDVRKIGQLTSDTSPGKANPIVHERKQTTTFS